MKRNKLDYHAIRGFVYDYWKKNMRSPSIREVQNGCGISSTSVANYALNVLHEEGKIIFSHDATSRNIIPIEMYNYLQGLD